MSTFKVGDAVEVAGLGSPTGKLEYGEIIAGPHSGAVYEVKFDSGGIRHVYEQYIAAIATWPYVATIPKYTLPTGSIRGTFYDSHSAASTKKSDTSENYTDWYAEQNETERQKRKDEGRCMDCGTLMYFDPRSLHLMCPTHGALLNSNGF